VFTRILFGARISLSIGLVGIAISLALGISIGGVSGFYGGAVDIVVQRVIEFIRSIPTVPLWMGLSAALPTDMPPLTRYFGITVILSLIGWTGLARVVRGRFLSLREQDFVMAAKLAGASEWRIITRHMVPSFMSHLIASVTLSIPGMILGETSLSFLGLGLRPPIVSWGVMLKDAQKLRVVAQAPWLLLPGVFVVVTVLAFNFVGDGLRDAVDPYAR
jgi:peptide/nickel transport system permease protein